MRTQNKRTPTTPATAMPIMAVVETLLLLDTDAFGGGGGGEGVWVAGGGGGG